MKIVKKISLIDSFMQENIFNLIDYMSKCDEDKLSREVFNQCLNSLYVVVEKYTRIDKIEHHSTDIIGIIGCRRIDNLESKALDPLYYPQKNKLIYSIEFLQHFCHSYDDCYETISMLVNECMADKNDAFAEYAYANRDNIDFGVLEKVGFVKTEAKNPTDTLYLRAPVTY